MSTLVMLYSPSILYGNISHSIKCNNFSMQHATIRQDAADIKKRYDQFDAENELQSPY